MENDLAEPLATHLSVALSGEDAVQQQATHLEVLEIGGVPLEIGGVVLEVRVND